MSTVLFYTLSWFGLMIIAILNGALRVSTYGKQMPEIRAHQLSCLTGIVLFGLAFYLLDTFKTPASGKQALSIGVIWLIMTILFEFSFGHYIMKHPWKKLFHDYRIDKGRLWLFVLIWVFVGPFVIYHCF